MNQSDEKRLSNKRILAFWAPLAATWLMMSVEGPFLAALIARMAEPKFNLAAYGVAFSFALIIEAPVIMFMSASTALVKGRYSYCKLRNFVYTTNAAITVLMLILIIPPIFNFIAVDLINLPEKVAGLTHTAVIILLPWPAAIGYRRFFQGILIRNNQTRKVAYGTIVRLVSMGLTATILYIYFHVDGVVIGASALSVGVTMEGIASKLMSLRVLKEIKQIRNEEDKNLTQKGIFQFYYPLALTSIIGLGVQPMVTFFIGQSRMSLESLAVLPVITSLVFIFRSLGLSFQEVGLAMMGDKMKNYKPLRNFMLLSAGGVVVALIIIAFTPLAEIWFFDVSGLSMELTLFAILPLMIMTIMPGLTYLISFQRAVLVYSGNTKPISNATAFEVVGILIVLFVAIKYLSLVGAVAAAIAFVLGRLCANIYLIKPYKEALKAAGQ